MSVSEASMNRETALRIALATRALPGISVGQLLDILQQRINGPLDEGSLQSVTVTDLQRGLSGDEELALELPALKDAVRILWGETVSEELPQAQEPAQLPADSIRVALASNNGERLDGHFGSCLRFLIYQVGRQSSTLVAVRSTLEADCAEDKNAFRADLIKDCQVLYVVSIGGPAAAKVIKAGVYPIKRGEGSQAAEVIGQLQQVMTSNPPPWLAKLMGVAAEQRVRFALSEVAS